MTDETKTAEATKTVDDIKSRMVFDSPAAALSYIGEISDYEGFGDLQQAIVGLLVDDDGNPIVDDEGNPQIDPAIYDSTMQVAVTVLSEKDTGAKKWVPVGLAENGRASGRERVGSTCRSRGALYYLKKTTLHNKTITK